MLSRLPGADLTSETLIEESLLKDSRHHLIVRTPTATALYVLNHKRSTLAELERTRSWMLLLGRKSASEKVATFLIDMSERLVDAGCEGDDSARTRFELPFSRQQVADVLGLTIETVSRQFTRLKADGLIDLPSRREVVIIDREGLAAEAG